MRGQVLAVLGLLGSAAASPCVPITLSSSTASQSNTAVSAASSTGSADSASASASGSVSADASGSASGSVSADASASSAADVSSTLSSLDASSTVSVASGSSVTVSSDDSYSTSGSISVVASDASSTAASSTDIYSSDASSTAASSTDVYSSDASSSTDVSSISVASDASSTAVSSTEVYSSDASSSTDVSSISVASDASSSTIPATTDASSTVSSTSSSASPSSTEPVTVESLDSTVLILARDDEGATSGASGLLGYGIPFQKLIVPKDGIELPAFSSGGKGNFGAIIIVDAVSYEYTDGWRSAITTEQWATIHKYQTDFHVRMVRINEYPGPAFGATVEGGGCCENGDEQLVSFTDVSDFPTANLKIDAGITTKGLYHYPSRITDPDTTKQVAKFGPGGPQTTDTVAAVINNFDGREQFVWFTSWAPTWSATSNYLQHAHIHWMTRGVFLGKRKIHLSAQIDDVQLETELYYPAGTTFKIRTGDLEGHVEWQKDINTRLPAGSDFWLELAHNGNGVIENATLPEGSGGVCNPDYAVWYDEAPTTELEFKKPPGTGADRWPAEFETYGWTEACQQRDPFAVWFQDANNLNAFGHLSHTFTHLLLNNATYHDAEREIQFNQAWFKQIGIDKANRWSPNGLVPPAITGLHNADVINAWVTNGITNVVGDNTRPVLRSTESQFWPMMTTVERNGAEGLTVVPRFATTIYFNCDTAECTTREWRETSAGVGEFDALLAQAKSENTRYLLGLHADPYMFHQANMRQEDMPEITVGTKTGKLSIVSAWVETVAQEMTRLTNWPITTLKHDDIAQYFRDRMTVDKCKPTLSYGYSADGKSITSVTVGAEGNTCDVPVPVTIPSGSVSGGNVVADQVGSEPPIQWVKLNGSPVTLSLSSAVGVAA